MPLTMRARSWPSIVAPALALLVASSAEAQQRYAQPARPQGQQPVQQQPARPAAAPPRQGTQPPVRQAQAQTPVAPQQQPQPPAQQQAPAAPQKQAPVAPFQLTPAEIADLDKKLQAWETATQAIKTMTCKFTRWETDKVFNKMTQSTGEIKFGAPDKGVYHVNDVVNVWPLNDPKAVRQETISGEYWICDGLSVFEFDAKQKQVVERKLPPELQGKAIVDGPLPFLFSADATKLKQRYWLRIVTPAEHQETAIWIQALPRFQPDAANFQSATLILRTDDMQATHLQIVMPGGKTETVHAFSNTSINGIIDWVNSGWAKPKIPAGWKLVQAQPAPPQQQSAPPSQTQRVPLGPRPAAQAQRPAAPNTAPR